MYCLVDRPPDAELEAASRMLANWCAQKDPVVKAQIEAQEDHERSTPKEDQQIQEGWEEP